MLQELKKLYANQLDFSENQVGQEIQKFLVNKENIFQLGESKAFFETLIEKAQEEIDENPVLQERINAVKSIEDLKVLLFPENELPVNEESIETVRKQREVTITESNHALTNPVEEILFTSNVMLTLPKDTNAIAEKYRTKIDFSEPQEYWFDHPIPLDIKEESNEILYGLRNFNQSVGYEIEKGKKARIVLSVSCTHPSLKNIAKEYLIEKLEKESLDNLEVYIFTENECQELLEILFQEKCTEQTFKDLQHTFGVDGKYGRHYTFLKAISAFFQAHVDCNIKATYKIDLDQVFDQEKIKEYTGGYAFEKLVNNKFGATGVDVKGNKVKLGMVAGYLINDVDIDKSMYEADVPMPLDTFNTEQYVFNSQRPQYISTVAEMLGRDSSDDKAIMRYHITGGMNGILIQDLCKYKPFTPSFITRAEDQCFMLSIVNKPVDGEYLRCYHQPGFFMRHDKGTFLQEDLKIFEVPKKVGDYERILLFSHYAKDILHSVEKIKTEIQPFTSAFITAYPNTLILFRMLFASYELAKKSESDAKQFLELCASRLPVIMHNIENNVYVDAYNSEVRAWEYYYDHVQQGAEDKIASFIEGIQYRG